MEIILDSIVTRRLKPYTSIKQVITGNNPLTIKAGWNLAVPNCWTLHSMYAQLACDANAANRFLKIWHYSDNIVVGSIQSIAQIANETKSFCLSPESDLGNMTKIGDRDGTLTNESFFIGGDDYIYVNVANCQVGDVLTIAFLFKWRNWDLGMMLPKVQKDHK